MDINQWTVGDYVTISYFHYELYDEDCICHWSYKPPNNYPIHEKECLIIGVGVSDVIDPLTGLIQSDGTKQPFILVEELKFRGPISNEHCKKYNIDVKYKDKHGILLPADNIRGTWILSTRKAKVKSDLDGKTCCNPYCKEFCQFADSNLPDDKFICRSCRTNVVTRDLTLSRLGFSLKDVRNL